MVRANGTLRFTENPDGSFDLFGTGRNVLIFFPGDMGPNGPVPYPGALYLHEGTTQSTYVPPPVDQGTAFPTRVA